VKIASTVREYLSVAIDMLVAESVKKLLHALGCKYKKELANLRMGAWRE
jgi:transposase